MTTWTLQDLPYTPEEDEAFKKMTEDQERREKEDADRLEMSNGATNNQPQSFWNHRVVLMPNDGTGTRWYEVQEVYYNRRGEPCGYCNSYIGGETMQELEEQIERHKQAITLPVLNTETDFNNRWEDDYEKEY
jgi:hypothetical protein